jgi:hypothetical protein
MALSTYANLLTAVAGWLNRTDLTSNIPDFIALAEAEFNRRLRTIEMEARATATLTSDAVAVPTDFIGLRSIKIANTKLEYAPPSEIYDDETTGGYPTRYTVTDGQFVFRPAPTSGTVVIDYFATIPALTVSNTTNWLMTKHPDLYLFATCAQAEFYLVNDARVPAWKGRTEELIEQINSAVAKERYGGRRLVAQHRVPQARNILA